MLPATTVINVDSVAFYDAAFPGGTALTGVAPGATVYVRSRVSDPFGAADITAAQLTLTDANGAPHTNVALDPAAIVASDAASKTYEQPITLPPDAAVGDWHAAVRGDEGFEGTVSHTAVAALAVAAAPTVLIDKTVLTTADPSGGAAPKSIPGATMTYTINVTNLGPGTADADSVVIVDDLPPQGRLLFDTTTGDPIVFIDGTTPSGLSYRFDSPADVDDDVVFSNDGGATSIAPVYDALTGVDLTSPRINHLRINPKGSLAPTASAPSFTLRLLMRLD